jgi:hypothetical protein
VVDIEDDTGLDFSMLVFLRRSMMYLCWERTKPSEASIASISKKNVKGPRSFKANLDCN